MRIRRSSPILRWASVGTLLLAIILLTIQLIIFSRSRITYPSRLEIGGVPVGGLTREQAEERLLQVYNVAVELNYEGAYIHLDPAVVGFDLNLESMLATADLTRIGGNFWVEFWDFIWSRERAIDTVPLDATYSEANLRSYLENEIARRYDQPAVAARPQVGSSVFQPGESGTTVDIDRAVIMIENALFSATERRVNLPIEESQPGRTSFENLEILLKQILDVAEFDGTAALYLMDLQTSDEIHFIYYDKQDYPTEPDLAFTASSVIKIPIMVSAYHYLDEPTPEEATNLISLMIEESGNDPADWLMEQYMSVSSGPLLVTEDMQALGLNNTFLAGYFYIGAPLLYYYDIPGNNRTDLNNSPDPYNQTTVSDIGMLLTDLYQCAELGGGSFMAVFPGQISQSECVAMIETLTRNYTPFLLEAGAPDGTKIAHKHGWVSDVNTGAITTIGDAGIVYTPSGNYVLVMYFSHPTQLVWDPNSKLMGDLAEAVYNYYNPN